MKWNWLRCWRQQWSLHYDLIWCWTAAVLLSSLFCLWKDVSITILTTVLCFYPKGEEHFNCISALHKSMRGSDENASLYWLGRMLEGGEDPLYVARRMVRFASEDVGKKHSNSRLVLNSFLYFQCVAWVTCVILISLLPIWDHLSYFFFFF